MKTTDNCKTRFAPSPSGSPHAGNIRTAIMAWLWAKHNKQPWVLRIEDTNKETSTPESIKTIFDTLEWLGMKSDEEVIYQSNRTEIYNEYVEKLLKAGHAYKCYCSKEILQAKRESQLANREKPKYDRTCLNTPDQPGKPFVVRLKMPDFGGFVYRDLILGRTNVRYAELTDTILQREDGSVTFLLANMLDDALQGIGCIVRGSDGRSHVQYQRYLCEILGFPIPNYAHLPFVLNASGDKLSKRNGDDSILELKAKGYLPHAVINALVRIGWSHGNDEIFSLDDLIDKFDLNKVGKSAGVFDPQKLDSINKYWMKATPPEELVKHLIPFLEKLVPRELLNDTEYLCKVIKSLQTRSATLIDMANLCLMYYQPVWERELLKNEKGVLQEFIPKIESIESFTQDNIQKAAEETGINIQSLFPVLRYAITGRYASPPVVEVAEILGKDEVVRRIKKCLR